MLDRLTIKNPYTKLMQSGYSASVKSIDSSCGLKVE